MGRVAAAFTVLSCFRSSRTILLHIRAPVSGQVEATPYSSRIAFTLIPLTRTNSENIRGNDGVGHRRFWSQHEFADFRAGVHLKQDFKPYSPFKVG